MFTRRFVSGTTGALLAVACIAGDAAAQATPTDGSHDFDWEIGTWRTEVRVLAAPLTGSDEWLEFEGTTVVSAAVDGRANLAELDVSGPAGRIRGVSLRLYEPQADQWSINWANTRDGLLTAPVYGRFRDGRGEFYGLDRIDGRTVVVRFVMHDVTPTSAQFEQAYSTDGGQTWEVNWVAVDTRME